MIFNLKKKGKEKPNVFNFFIEKAKNSNKTIILPEGDDDRVIEAAKKASLLNLCKIIILGNDLMLTEKFTKNELKNIEVLDPIKNTKKREMYANTYYELRKHKGMTPEKAMEEMKDNMKFACLMLYSGDADGVVAGAVYKSADVMKPALQVIKNRADVSKVCSCFIMEVKKELGFGENGFMIFADCGLIVNPTDSELADITILSAEFAKNICDMKPRVAMLSYTSKSPEDFEDETVQKVKRAYRLVRRRDSSLICDGELQLDAAIVPAVQKQKAKDSVVEGKANVLVFPDLNAGNIGYKMAQRFSGGKAIGPIMMGLKKPVNDLSRGATADEIVDNIAITILQSNYVIKGE